MDSFNVAVLQYCGTKDWQTNLDTVSRLIHNAQAHGAEFILLPECANNVNLAAKADDYFSEQDDPFLTAMQKLAQSYTIIISIGSLMLKHENGKCANRGFTINDAGKIIARYDKIHLFDVNLTDRQYRESDKFASGNQAIIAETDKGKIGMTICYDLRFANLYTELAKAGALAITVPAAFTATTGRAHWEVLLRARAIENGVYIFAAAQVGTHEDERETWGHSMIVDPWGKIIARAEIDEKSRDGSELGGFTLAEIKPSIQARAQNTIPRLTQIKGFNPPLK